MPKLKYLQLILCFRASNLFAFNIFLAYSMLPILHLPVTATSIQVFPSSMKG